MRGLAGFQPAGTAAVYRYSASTPGVIVRQDDLAVTSAGFSTTFPASSITVIVLPPGSAECTYAIAPSSQAFPATGGNGTVELTTQDACSWTAVSSADWIHVTAAGSAAGSGSVSYTVDASRSSKARSGTMLIGGQTFTVTQAAVPCRFGLTPTSATSTASGGSGVVAVSATADNCAWTATSKVAWATITSGASGSGPGSVGYQIAPRTVAASRSASLRIAGLLFPMTQSGCTFTIAPSSATFTKAGGAGSVSVTASGTSCAWTAHTSAAWIRITGGTPGAGSGTVTYTIVANASRRTRSGNITIAGKTFKVTQGG